MASIEQGKEKEGKDGSCAKEKLRLEGRERAALLQVAAARPESGRAGGRRGLPTLCDGKARVFRGVGKRGEKRRLLSQPREKK